jgi:pimeloyl-ACP methyl ester carboxylesterase
LAKRVKAADKGNAEALVRAFIDGLQDGTCDQLPEIIRKVMLRNTRELEAFAASEDMFPGLDRDAVRKLGMPTLIVTGDKTLAFLKKIDDELERLQPEKGRQHIIIRDADHEMLFMKAEECRKVILEFIRGK